MSDRKRPNITLTMFGTANSSMNHHGESGTNSCFDEVLGDTVVMAPANTNLIDALVLGVNLMG